MNEKSGYSFVGMTDPALYIAAESVTLTISRAILRTRSLILRVPALTPIDSFKQEQEIRFDLVKMVFNI